MYRKRFAYKPKKFAKKTYKRKTKSVYKIAKSAATRVIAQRMNTKSTYVEQALSVTDGILVFGVNWPAQGVDDNERIQNEIWLKSLTFRFSLAAQDETNIVRLILIQWMDATSGTEPAASNIFFKADSDFTAYSPLNGETASKYRVLMDKTYALNIGGGELMHREMCFKKFPMKKIKFSTTDGTGNAHIEKGSIYGYIVSDSAVSGPAFTYSIRLNYTDA